MGTTACGKLQVNGRWIDARIKYFEPFRVGGRYLLLVKFVPTTGAYQAFEERSFELRDGRVFKLTPDRLWNETVFPPDDAEAFVREVRVTSTYRCHGE